MPIGSVAALNWETESGFRVGGMYQWPGEGWGVGACYTYLHSNASDQVARPAGGTLFPTLTHPGGIEQVDSAAATSGLNYQVLDIDVGCAFTISDSFCLRPFAGGRFAWIDQSLNAFYNGGDANFAAVHSPVDFEGAGIRVGAEGKWKTRWGLSLYARGSGALVAGDVHTRLTETNNNGATTNVDVTDNFEKLVPVVELGVGVGWEYRSFQVRVGYEMSNWFGLVESPDFTDDVSQGKISRRTSDLSLEGLVVQLGMTF
jgi:hypothetical protein